MARTARTLGIGAIVMASAILVSGVVSAQQNPILSATQAPPPVASGGFYPSPYSYGYGSPYGPYGQQYPYQSYNPSVQQLANPQQNPNAAVPNQPTQPGQVQLPMSQGGGGGGGGSGQQGSGGGNNGGNGDPARGASYDIMKNPTSPLYKRYERDSLADQQIRPRILEQIGRGKGIRRGFIEEVGRLRASVEASGGTRLDARYDFTKLMIGEHLVPPVIGEVHGVQQRGGDRLLYLTVGAFQIVRPARLVITPPSWRDYLFIEVADPRTSIMALAPKNSEEQGIYDRAYDAGLARGIEEARETFEDNLNRLERDYSGMERYHELARQGAVSLPVVKDARHAVRVADNGQRAFVGEQIVTLRISPRFKAVRRGAFK